MYMRNTNKQVHAVATAEEARRDKRETLAITRDARQGRTAKARGFVDPIRPPRGEAWSRERSRKP